MTKSNQNEAWGRSSLVVRNYKDRRSRLLACHLALMLVGSDEGKVNRRPRSTMDTARA
jgi:hypothetical protein